MGPFVRAYLRLMAALTALSCLGLLIIPAQLGALSSWGAAGWQREIALWNLAMYILIARTLRRRDPAAERLLAAALVVLNLLVAANHFATIVYGPIAPLNAIAGAVNAAAGTIGAIALWRTRDADAATKPPASKGYA